MQSALTRIADAAITAAGTDDAGPHRVYTLASDRPPAPALYAEFDVDDRDEPVAVILHNLRYYEMAMDVWDLDLVELIALNELHELTHWAMTDEERERYDVRSRRLGRPDGYWLNPMLLEILDWLPGKHRTVFENAPGDSPLAWLGWWLRRLRTRAFR